MKWIRYDLFQGKTENGQDILHEKLVGYTDINEEIAKREAYNGEYTIEDGGYEKSVPEKIRELKALLSATDYKVIKCSECQLLGQEMPYDIAELHAQRQAIRDQINELEKEK